MGGGQAAWQKFNTHQALCWHLIGTVSVSIMWNRASKSVAFRLLVALCVKATHSAHTHPLINLSATDPGLSLLRKAPAKTPNIWSGKILLLHKRRTVSWTCKQTERHTRTDDGTFLQLKENWVSSWCKNCKNKIHLFFCNFDPKFLKRFLSWEQQLWHHRGVRPLGPSEQCQWVKKNTTPRTQSATLQGRKPGS